MVYPIRPGGDLIDCCDFVQQKVSADFKLTYLRAECEVSTPNSHSFKQALVIFEVVDCINPLAPFQFQWVPQSSVGSITLEPFSPTVAAYLDLYQANALTIHADRLYPYSLPGWYNRASQWLFTALKQAAYTPTTISKHKQSSEGSIMIATTASGLRFYMKAVHNAGMGNETAVTCALAHVLPAYFSIPVAVDMHSNCILMHDYGQTLDWSSCRIDTAPGMMENVLTEWAIIQKQSVPVAHKLLQYRVPIMDGQFLMQKAAQMMDDPVWFEEQRKNMTSQDQHIYTDFQQYKANYLAYIARVCQKANQYNVPMCLVHGDLNAVNVIKTDSGCRFIDFALTSISYPFCDALSFASSCGARRDQLGFYLNQWTEYESMSRLWELLLIVDDIDNIFSLLVFYEGYALAEQSERNYNKEDIGVPVCRYFSKYHHHVPVTHSIPSRMPGSSPTLQ